MKATSVPLSDQQKGPPRRVRIFEQGAPNAVGKLVIIPPNCSFSEFLLMCGRKLGVKALQVFLDDSCEVEDIMELHDGDVLYVHGVKDEFPGEEGLDEMVSLQDGSYSSGSLQSSVLADADFKRAVAGGMGSLARRLDELSSQLKGVEVKMDQLMQGLSGVPGQEPRPVPPVASPQQQQQQLLEQSQAGQAPEEMVRRKAAESVKMWRQAQVLEGHTGPVWCLVAVEVRNILISGSSDTTIKIWDIFTFKCRHTLKGHLGIIHSLLVAGSLCYSASDDKSIRVWDLNTISSKKILQEHEDCVVSLALSTNGRYLFSGSYHQIRVWDTQNDHKCVKILIGHNHWVRALHVAETYLFSGCHNMIKIWDADKLELMRTINTNGVGKSIYSITVVGSLLLAGCFENQIQVWDLKSFEMTHKLSAHRGAVYCTSVSGHHLFSGSYDNTVRVWDLRTMQCIQVLKGHTSKVEAICTQLLQAQTPMLFSASSDHSVRVWTQARIINFG